DIEMQDPEQAEADKKTPPDARTGNVGSTVKMAAPVCLASGRNLNLGTAVDFSPKGLLDPMEIIQKRNTIYSAQETRGQVARLKSYLKIVDYHLRQGSCLNYAESFFCCTGELKEEPGRHLDDVQILRLG
ncbi:hypothetical protein STEG23_019682, partial [Scotinomys teguina]